MTCARSLLWHLKGVSITLNLVAASPATAAVSKKVSSTAWPRAMEGGALNAVGVVMELTECFLPNF